MIRREIRLLRPISHPTPDLHPSRSLETDTLPNKKPLVLGAARGLAQLF
jgi:hypothetical protein